MDTGSSKLSNVKADEPSLTSRPGELTATTALSSALDAPPPRLIDAIVGRPDWAACLTT